MDATAPASSGSCPGGRSFGFPAGGAPHAASDVTEASTTTPIGYFADGTVQSVGSRTYLYDDLGRLTLVKEGGQAIKQVAYRADGNAVKVSLGGATRYRPSEDFEWDATAGLGRIYVGLGGRTIAIHEEVFNPPDPGPPACGSILPATRGPGAPPAMPGAELLLLLAYGLSGVAAARLVREARRRPWTRRGAVASGTATVFAIVMSVPPMVVTPRPAEAVSPPDVTYLHADALGSSSFTSDETGSASLRRVVYRPFGEAVDPGASGGTNPPQLGFTGQRLEADIGLYDYGARWYDPALGRFLQPDALAPTYDPQGFNPYAYVRNDPVNRVDPSGNCSREIFSFCFGSASVSLSFGRGIQFPEICGRDGIRDSFCTGDFGSLSNILRGVLQGQMCVGAFCGPSVGGFGGLGFAEELGDAEKVLLGSVGVIILISDDVVGGEADDVFIPSAITLVLEGLQGLVFEGLLIGSAVEDVQADNGIVLEQQSGEDNLEGDNARDGGNRTNTDLPGGRDAAEGKFEELTKGQPTTKHPMPNGGERERAPDGTQIRRNPDGTTRIDVPGRGPHGLETIHYD